MRRHTNSELRRAFTARALTPSTGSHTKNKFLPFPLHESAPLILSNSDGGAKAVPQNPHQSNWAASRMQNTCEDNHHTLSRLWSVNVFLFVCLFVIRGAASLEAGGGRWICKTGSVHEFPNHIINNAYYLRRALQFQAPIHSKHLSFFSGNFCRGRKREKKNPDSALLPVFIPHIGISQSEFSHLKEAGGQAVAESAVPRRSLVSPFFSWLSRQKWCHFGSFTGRFELMVQPSEFWICAIAGDTCAANSVLVSRNEDCPRLLFFFSWV